MYKSSCNSFCMAFSMPGGPEILNIELSSSSVLKYLTSIALFMKPISPLQLSFGIEEDVVRNTVDAVKFIIGVME